MTGQGDWERWGAEWRGGNAAGAADAISRASVRAQAVVRRSRLIEALVAVGGVAMLGGAVAHAATVAESLFALGVGALILIVWLRRLTDRRSEAHALASPTDEFAAIQGRLLRRQVALGRYAIIVAMLTLAFLGPWWVSGVREHAGDVSAAVLVWTVWLPITSIFGLLAWAVWTLRRARRALHGMSAPQ